MIAKHFLVLSLTFSVSIKISYHLLPTPLFKRCIQTRARKWLLLNFKPAIIYLLKSQQTTLTSKSSHVDYEVYSVTVIKFEDRHRKFQPFPDIDSMRVAYQNKPDVLRFYIDQSVVYSSENPKLTSCTIISLNKGSLWSFILQLETESTSFNFMPNRVPRESMFR